MTEDRKAELAASTAVENLKNLAKSRVDAASIQSVERIARLEAALEHVERDTTDLRQDMKDVRERLVIVETKVDALPSKGYVVTVVTLGFAFMTALLAFQDRIQAYLGTAT